jgi:hypothetical protein
LVDHRDDLVGERPRAQQRLRWHLHELDLRFERRDARPTHSLKTRFLSLGPFRPSLSNSRT